jgi:hypothetical protein
MSERSSTLPTRISITHLFLPTAAAAAALDSLRSAVQRFRPPTPHSFHIQTRKCAAAAVAVAADVGAKGSISRGENFPHKLDVIEVEWVAIKMTMGMRSVLCANRAVNHIRRQ